MKRLRFSYCVVRIFSTSAARDKMFRDSEDDAMQRHEFTPFTSKKSALKDYNKTEQYQSATEGEVNRLLCKIEMSKRG